MFTNRMAFCSHFTKRKEKRGSCREVKLSPQRDGGFHRHKNAVQYLYMYFWFIYYFIYHLFTVQHCVYSSFHLGPEIRLPMHCIMDNSGFRFFQESVKYK